MTCVACQAAEVGPGYVYRKGCKGCSARQIARGPDFHRCRNAGKQDGQYRDLLAAVGVTHEQAVEASRIDKERAAA